MESIVSSLIVLLGKAVKSSLTMPMLDKNELCKKD